VELTAIERLSNNAYAQVINYLRATGYHRALLLNFATPRLEDKRFVFGRETTDDTDDTDKR
jgi:GxxExxY protein